MNITLQISKFQLQIITFCVQRDTHFALKKYFWLYHDSPYTNLGKSVKLTQLLLKASDIFARVWSFIEWYQVFYGVHRFLIQILKSLQYGIMSILTISTSTLNGEIIHSGFSMIKKSLIRDIYHSCKLLNYID